MLEARGTQSMYPVHVPGAKEGTVYSALATQKTTPHVEWDEIYLCREVWLYYVLETQGE